MPPVAVANRGQAPRSSIDDLVEAPAFLRGGGRGFRAAVRPVGTGRQDLYREMRIRQVKGDAAAIVFDRPGGRAAAFLHVAGSPA